MNVLKKYVITASVLVAVTTGCGVAQGGGHGTTNSGGSSAGGISLPGISINTGSPGSDSGSSTVGSGTTTNNNNGGGGKGGSGSGHTNNNNNGGGNHHRPTNNHTINPVTPVIPSLPAPTGTIGYPGVSCRSGYVWRKAFAGDYACVAPAVRSQAAADNAAAASRIEPGGGAYGIYTCKQGYVWRGIVKNDYACVLPAVRAEAAADNAQVANRIALPQVTGTVGYPGVPCLSGYVWREAFAGDYACVAPAVRSQAAADNAAAASRIEPGGGGAYGPYTCKQGYVWRGIVKNDYACVLPAVRARAAADNAQVDNRAALLRVRDRAVYGGFPPTSTFQIDGDHFNFGRVVVLIRRNDGTLLWSTTATATAHPGYAGGSLFIRTSVSACAGVSGGFSHGYAVAYDTVSRRWSSEIPLDLSCA